MQLLVEIQIRIFAGQQFLQLADRRPLDRLAGDRAFEDVMGLVLGVDGQLEVEAVVDVDVREDARLAVFDDLLAFEVELAAGLFEQVGDEGGAVAEDVQVDVGAFADVAGHDAADEPRPEGAEQPHQAQGVQAHVARCSVRLSPSWMRAKSWICSRISALEGRSSGLTPGGRVVWRPCVWR